MFKDPKTLDEMITYLRTSKNILIEMIDEEHIKEELLLKNYINLISPFKYYFCKKDKNGKPVKDENDKHIYESSVDIDKYLSKYSEERNKYPIIFHNITNFESKFNAIVSYHVIVNKKFKDQNDFIDFCNTMKMRALQNISDTKLRNNMIDDINGFLGNQYGLEKYKDIYVFFDRLSMHKLLTIFQLVDSDIHNAIYKDLEKHKLTLGMGTVETFIKRVQIVINIRNTVYHSNSLEVLKRYYSINKKELRKSSDQKSYARTIEYLAKSDY